MTLGYYPQHCSGCRCNSWVYTTTTTSPSIFTYAPAYQPKHRKSGPAQ